MLSLISNNKFAIKNENDNKDNNALTIIKIYS